MAVNNKRASVTLSNNLLHVSSCPGSHIINITTGGVDNKAPVKGVDYFTQEEIDEITNAAAEKAVDAVEDIYRDGTPVVDLDKNNDNSGDIEDNPSGEDDVIEF